jgi:hypothetical protein
MERSEFEHVIIKMGTIDGRTFFPAQKDAWFEIAGSEHTLADALAAVVTFYSKPFTHHAYPGDIKALILEIEGVRLRRCGTLETNEQEWFNGPTAPVYAQLRRLISTGEWTLDDYRSYRRSGLTLIQYMEEQGAPVG